MEKNYETRHFRLWYFSISHSMALIRSPKNNIYPTNIDICFSAVEYIDCPVGLEEIIIEEADLNDLEYMEKRFKKGIKLSDITVLVSMGKRFYIVSHGVKIAENKLDYMELPCGFIKLNPNLQSSFD